MSENAEEVKTNTEQVAPAPVTAPAPAKVEAPVVEAKPTESPVEDANKKQTAAFIKMRQEARELKRQLAEARANSPVPPAPTPVEQPKQEVVAPSPAPVQANTENDIEEEAKAAIATMASDPRVSGIPGATIDILNMIDGDKGLTKLYNEFPKLAIREAVEMYLSKAGVAPVPEMPKSAPTSGGMSGSSESLEVLMAEIEKHRPGSKEFTRLANMIDAEMKKQGNPW